MIKTKMPNNIKVINFFGGMEHGHDLYDRKCLLNANEQSQQVIGNYAIECWWS